ncbi:MAG: 6-phosphofructokinase, partial [Anaerolineae bacterium]|nr:6-phosphofructokinase [Anaerolineae bacterium]
PLNKQVVRTVDRTGGTFLHTSRTNPGNVKAEMVPEFLRGPNWDPDSEKKEDFTPHILKNIEHLQLDVLIAIGGDDTLGYANRIHRHQVPIIAIPKTMDNDVYGTDYCIGFSTAVTRSVDIIHNLRTPIGSHERIGVIELFGRHCGQTALISAYLADADRTVIAEVPFDPEKLATLLLKDKRENPSNYSLMTISEGATMIGGTVVEHGEADAYGHRKLGGIGEVTAKTIRKITQQNTIYQHVGYMMRSGAADSVDLMVSFNFANMAMDLVNQKQVGRMVALREGQYRDVPASILGEGVKRVDVDEFYNIETYRPKVRRVSQKPMFLY